MKLNYQWKPDVIRLEERVNGNDVEFQIELLQEGPYVKAMGQVQKYFEANNIHTDVLFYVYPEHRYQVIVRKDYYNDFVLELMRRQLLTRVEWI